VASALLTSGAIILLKDIGFAELGEWKKNEKDLENTAKKQ